MKKLAFAVLAGSMLAFCACTEEGRYEAYDAPEENLLEEDQELGEEDELVE